MFDAPIDAWYVWIGVATASLAVAGVGLSAHTTPAPDAPAVAATVDATASEPYAATAVHPIRADTVRLDTHRIELQRDDRQATAVFDDGPVVPVHPDTDLWAVVTGSPPEQVFDSPEELQDAVERARTRDPAWRPPTQRLVVRSLVWDDIEVTMVGV